MPKVIIMIYILFFQYFNNLNDKKYKKKKLEYLQIIKIRLNIFFITFRNKFILIHLQVFRVFLSH